MDTWVPQQQSYTYTQLGTQAQRYAAGSNYGGGIATLKYVEPGY